VWRSFGWRDHALALQAGLLGPLVALLLRTTSVEFCQRVLRHKLTGSRVPAMEPVRVHHMAEVMAFGCRRYTFFRSACLVRSLTLQHLLARRGIEASLHFGSRFAGNEFCAHAWVEYQGQPLAEAQIPRELYATFE